MSDSYTKLFSSITESTVWGEPYPTRIVWVAMLAMADKHGNVYGSIPGLARRANVTLQEAEAALAAFRSPDPYSRTQAEDGRRIEDVDGGWRLVNHGKYAAVRNAEERADYKREWDRKNRSKCSESDKSDTIRQLPTETTGATPPALTPTLKDQKQASTPAASVDFKADLFKTWKALPDSGGGAFLNKLFRDHKPEQRVMEAVEQTIDHGPADPKAFVLGKLRQEVARDTAYDELMSRVI